MSANTVNDTVPVKGVTERWDMRVYNDIAERVFKPHGYTLPEVRFRTGTVPGTKGTSVKVLGLYVPGSMAADGMPSIFTSPLIGDGFAVAEVLSHEAIHAMFPDAGHKGTFASAARKIGLEGPLTATHAGEKLAETLRQIVADNGPRPHGAISPVVKAGRPKQKTYMLETVCPVCNEKPGRSTEKQVRHNWPTCNANGAHARVLCDVTDSDGNKLTPPVNAL